MLRRLPKRGFNNPNHAVFNIINVGQLEVMFEGGTEVDELILKSRGILDRGNAGLKVLGDGELSKPLTIKAKKFSASARQKIEAAGGTCEVVA